MQRFFVSDPEGWEKALNRVQALDEPASSHTYENAFVLPPRIKENVKAYDGVYEGGVCDADGNFITGKLRSLTNENSNWSCPSGYSMDSSSVKFRDERVVYGGVIFRHFGHALLDMTSRFWYIAENHPTEKIVFIEYDRKFAQEFDPHNILQYLGVQLDQVEIIHSPTQFKEIIVPDETMFPLSGHYKPEYIKTFDAIRDNIKPAQHKKIYFTRRNYLKGDSFNEEYYEDFYKKRGFEVFSPEQLPFEDQIALIAGAEEFVTSVGTMSHLLLFAKPDIKATILTRTSTFITQQLVVDAVRGVSPYYVEAVRNVLPVEHVSGPFLFYPNRFFEGYLRETGESFRGEDLRCNQTLESFTGMFIAKWVEVHRTQNRASMLRKHTSANYLSCAYSSFYDEALPENVYFEADAMKGELAATKKELAAVKKELAKTKKELATSKATIKAMKNSKSWKLTKPLRALTKALPGAKDK